MKIEIRFGLFFPTIEEQLREQGFTLGSEAEEIESVRKSIFDCLFSDVATDKQVDSMFEKLNKKIGKIAVAIEGE